jgi:hypothetical protein
MPKKKCTVKNLSKVLVNLDKFAKEDKRDGKIIAQHLDIMLDELCSVDFFGTESQADPRGDQRD